VNATLPRGVDPSEISLEQALALLEAKAAKGPSPRGARKTGAASRGGSGRGKAAKGGAGKKERAAGASPDRVEKPNRKAQAKPATN
jgi:DNA topoisomerase-1